MDERGAQTEAPRTGLPRTSPSGFRVVFWIAFAISTVLVVGQVVFVLASTPVALHAARVAGMGALPPGLRFADTLGAIGLFSLLTIGDALIFAVFAWLARRYWIGLLFVPSILYLAGALGALGLFAVELTAIVR